MVKKYMGYLLLAIFGMLLVGCAPKMQERTVVFHHQYTQQGTNKVVYVDLSSCIDSCDDLSDGATFSEWYTVQGDTGLERHDDSGHFDMNYEYNFVGWSFQVQ